MTSRRTYLPYERALQISQEALSFTDAYRRLDVAWADQADAAMDEAEVAVKRALSTGKAMGGRGLITGDHATALAFQIIYAAESTGQGPTTCPHTRSFSTGKAFVPSAVPTVVNADPFVIACTSCIGSPAFVRELKELSFMFEHECDRCGGGGPITAVTTQSGVALLHYGSCETCLDDDQGHYVRGAAFRPVQDGRLR